MKKILLLLLIFAVAGYGAKLQAQCNIIQNNVIVQIVGSPISLGPNKCQFTINTQFDMTSNDGFKYLFFHTWLAADYPATPIFNCSSSNAQDPGTAAQLGTAVDDVGKSILDYGFLNILSGAVVGVPQNLTFATTYLHDNNVVLTRPSNSPGITATRTLQANGTYHFAINNIKIIVNQACGTALSVKSDIWGSNSNAPDPKAQCNICGAAQILNDPTITGFRNCDAPARKYTIGISTIDPTLKNITYKVYLDMNDNGTLETGTDELAFTSSTIQISAPGGATPDSYSSGLISLPAPYSNTQPYSEKGYLILVEGATLTNGVLKLLPNPGCAPLPVKLGSFTAKRNNASTVKLVWQTSSEVNTSGFEVQRNTKGNWETINFTPTQAPGGNSDIQLTYNYTDINSAKGISQYRIRQVDIDRRAEYSIIRSVRGNDVSAKTIIYPNPGFDSKVNVVFEDAAGSRDIVLMDMSGRVMRNWKDVINNNLVIDNLSTGFYSLRITVRETGIQTVEKFVINKR